MTWGELLEEEMEREDVAIGYILSPRLYNVSEYTMLRETENKGGYILKAPKRLLKEFTRWLLYEKGTTIDVKTNVQILASWREFLNAQIL